MKEIKKTVEYKNETEEYQVIGISGQAECLYTGTENECTNFMEDYFKDKYIENTKYSSVEIVNPKETIKSNLIQTVWEENDLDWIDDFLNN